MCRFPHKLCAEGVPAGRPFLCLFQRKAAGYNTGRFKDKAAAGILGADFYLIFVEAGGGRHYAYDFGGGIFG
jgi:hypothetical protein